MENNNVSGNIPEENIMKGILDNANIMINGVDNNIEICLDNAGIVYQDIIDTRLEIVSTKIKEIKHGILIDCAIAKELEEKVRHMLSMYNDENCTEDKKTILTCINSYINSCNDIFEKVQESIDELEGYKYVLSYLEELAKSKGGV